MAQSSLTAKFFLLAFAANVALCPCASLANESPTGAPSSAATASDGIAHSRHHPAAQSTDAVDHLDNDCHTDSPAEECGMVAGLDLDGGFDRADVAAAIHVDSRAAGPQVERDRQSERRLLDRWRPPDTPIARFDRLLT